MPRYTDGTGRAARRRAEEEQRQAQRPAGNQRQPRMIGPMAAERNAGGGNAGAAGQEPGRQRESTAGKRMLGPDGAQGTPEARGGGGAARRSGGAARAAGTGTAAPMGRIPEESPVRSGRAEDAYHQAERMGAEELMRQAGIEPGGKRGAGSETPQGMNKERLKKAEETLMEYRAGKKSVERRIIHAQEWWKMRNWREIEGTRGTKGTTEKKSATAWLWNCIVGKHADAIDSYPEPVILPRTMDDREEARRLSEIVPVAMQMNGFEETYSLCQWQKMQEGTAAYGVFWDKTKLNGMGDIAIRKINMLNLFWEPGITDIQESKNVFYVTYADNEQLESMYPELEGKLKNSALTISKYRTDDGISLDGKSAVVDWYYHKWQGMKKVLHYCKFVGETVLYATEDAGDGRGLYDDGDYPFVLDPLFPVEGSPAGYGYIDIGKDAQADIDTLNQAMVQNAVVASTPRYFMRKDGGINEEEFSDWSKPIIHVGGNLGQDSLVPVQANLMGNNAMNMMRQKIDELKFVTGNTDVNNGGTPSGVTAASAIAALKEDAGRSSKDSTKSAYRAFSKIVNMVIERIRQFYDLPRQFRILGPNGEERFTSYDNQHIAPQRMAGGLGLEEGMRLPVFDIEVRAQRENAYTKMSQNELALQFYNSGMFNPQMTDQALMCMDMMDFKGKEEVSRKIQQNGTLQEAIMQVGQIALALAQKHEPQIAERLAMTLQGVAGDQAMAAVMRSRAAAGGGAAGGGALGNSVDETKKANDPNENSIVRKAREQSEQASRPD